MWAHVPLLPRRFSRTASRFIPAGSARAAAGAAGDALELRLNVTQAQLVAAGLGPVGFSVRATNNKQEPQSEQTLVFYGASAPPSDAAAVKGAVHGLHGTGLEVHGKSLDPAAFHQDVVAPPLDPMDTYSLRVFVDRSVIESHVNGRLSATVRAYPQADDATNAFVINRGDRPVLVDSVEIWGMGSIY